MMDIEDARVETAPETAVDAQSQEVFERVWRRVMPDQDLSPVALGPAPDLGEPVAAAEEPPQRSVPLEPNVPAVEERPLEPVAYDAPCLGEASLAHTQLLQELMDDAQRSWQAYQAMARRARGQANRQLGELAADQRLCLRRLVAVYFLLTGRRARQPDRPPAPFSSLPDALREQFNAEQHFRARCLRGVREVRDFCLASLFQELAAHAQNRMEGIRRVLEWL